MNHALVYKKYLKKKDKVRKLKFNSCGPVVAGIAILLLFGIVFLVILV